MSSSHNHPASSDKANKAASSDSIELSALKAYLSIAQASLSHAANKQNPRANPICGCSLVVVLQVVENYVFPSTSDSNTVKPLATPRGRQLRHKYPEFVSALFAFMCTPRTRQELVELDDAMSECRCSTEHRRTLAALPVHGVAGNFPRAQDPFKVVVGVCAHILSGLLYAIRLDPLSSPAIKAQLTGNDVIYHYLVHKVDETLKLFATWLEYMRSSEMMFPISIPLHALPNFKTSLAKSGAFLEQIAQELGRIVLILELGLKLSDDDLWDLSNITSWLWLLLTPPEGPMVSEWFAQGGHGRTIYDHYMFLIHHDVHNKVFGQGPLGREPRSWMKEVARYIRGMFDESEYELLGPQLEPDCRLPNGTSLTLDNIGTEIPLALSHFRDSTNCYYPYCDFNRPNAPPFKNLPLPRCKGCNIVTYCSSRCQRLGWDYPHHAHKLICRNLKPLLSVWLYFGRGPHAIPDDMFISRVFTDAGFTESEHQNDKKQESQSTRNARLKREVQFMVQIVYCKQELFSVLYHAVRLKLGQTTVEDIEAEQEERVNWIKEYLADSEDRTQGRPKAGCLLKPGKMEVNVDVDGLMIPVIVPVPLQL